jgi:hypothetical protein
MGGKREKQVSGNSPTAYVHFSWLAEPKKGGRVLTLRKRGVLFFKKQTRVQNSPCPVRDQDFDREP